MIFTNLNFTQAQRQQFEQNAAPAEVFFAPPGSHDDATRGAFEAASLAFVTHLPADWFTRARKLAWVQLASVGFEEYLGLPDEIKTRVTVTNLKGVFSTAVAETVLAGILAFNRGVPELVRAQNEGRWIKLELRPRLKTLSHGRVLLLGYGDINRKVAELLAPFGVTLSQSSRSPDLGEATLDQQLAVADIVIAALPETPETRALLDRRRLELIKRGALLVNVGRGSLLDEAALADLLISGHLAGAALDVTDQEPLPPEHVMWRAPNVLLTQHTAGGSSNELDQKPSFFLDNLKRYRSCNELVSIVDWEKGY